MRCGPLQCRCHPTPPHASWPRALRRSPVFSSPAGGHASRAAEGPDAGDRVKTNRAGFHQVRAEALFRAFELGGELHQRDGAQVLRHQRVRLGAANEGSAGRRRRNVVALWLFLSFMLSLFPACCACGVVNGLRCVLLYRVSAWWGCCRQAQRLAGMHVDHHWLHSVVRPGVTLGI